MQRQAEIIGVEAESLEAFDFSDRYLDTITATRAEIFADAGCLYILTLDNPSGYDSSPEDEPPNRLSVSVVSTGSPAKHLDRILETCKEVMGCALSEYRYPSVDFKRLREEVGAALTPPSDIETSSSYALMAKENRELAIRIKKSFGMLVGDLDKKSQQATEIDVESAREALEKAGIVSSEFMVTCRRQNHQTARAPSAKLIEQMSASGIKCACGKPIAEEPLEEALTITDLGRSLLDKSRWLSLVVMNELQRLGVRDDEILIESTIGGDELDCIANVNGELCLFELKDKEFSLREAYSFGAKMSIVEPRHALIITSEYVGGDVKEHFERSRKGGRKARSVRRELSGRSVIYVEGVDNIRPKLEEFVSSIHRNDSAHALTHALPFAAISPASLLKALEQGGPSEREDEGGHSSSRRRPRTRAKEQAPQ
ncbi:hypothetical protein [Streptomyces hainanensis]|uniref:Uncharacterized protein n=1 Tax=Streptomyces hainanensis TaxID=402648 RepID=A0A4R4T2U5_9ACTN|nr:hypothetical protein [Streptomyces hainanensis]TDC69564.1 hypothetical protein E1283_25835 [Streptomyces hainanensis]